MGFLEDFWANINAGATTIATAPDPIINIGQPRKKPTPTPTPTPTTTTTSGGNTPANTRRSDQQIYDLIETYHGDDIKRLDRIHEEQEGRITDAWQHRQQIDENLQGQIKEHEVFWDEFGILHQKHLDQEGRISEKAGIGHTHPNGNSDECAWYDLGCHYGKSMEGLGKLALIGVVAFFIFMLIKKRLGL